MRERALRPVTTVPKARKSDLLLLFFNQFIWGTSWVAIKFAQEQMGPVLLSLWSLAISVLVLYPFVHSRLRAELRQRSLREYFDYLMMGFVGLSGMTLLYTWGAGRSLAANGALISTAVPVLTAVVAVMVLGERMTWIRVVSLGIALFGVLALSASQWSEVELFGGYLFANLLLFGGTLANAIYIVYSKKLLALTSPLLLLFWGQLIGFFGCIPFLYFEDFKLSSIAGYTGQTWASLAFLGAIFYAVTVIIFFRILVRLDAGQIMVSCYLQPVFGLVMAALMLGEEITAAMILGGLLVVAGTVLATYGEAWWYRRRKDLAAVPASGAPTPDAPR
jgi:drug/metabolite transporter (DMT)-like permease